MTEEDILKETHFKNANFKSFKDKYIILDNIETKEEPVVHAVDEIHNTRYTIVIVVLRGTMHTIINDKFIEIKSNDYLIVMPFMRLEILESRCIFFGMAIQNEIANDIYENSGIGRNVGVRYFCFHHYHFEKFHIELLLNDYSLLRIEQDRQSYPMQEITLRSFLTAFLAHLYSFRKETDEIPHKSNTRQQAIFDKFLNLVSLYYMKNRTVQFYADKINITPKYLSSIVNIFTGCSASVVIDRYVVCRIKQVLYANNANIKTISSQYNFPNQSFFGRYFKRITGMSPYDYLKKNNRKQASNL
ncbi:MAG: AraC family transcriptional regulator [Bacteroidaceae bacterium]|nr:AraC family transcriptional regulator [Bacteroidaceae bacterium]